ncbi:DBH-like monooxygenase protein 2 [Biomphalaria pfeifferi]|uniref:DBH-like monooxygenase protein 2 n=1 Tax=Biomphalaria pfeifferi TaxID=112525 RepID=A0AAD8EU41_BIOPF|nr:DBH-like monooxygenase protein 2 [Biomphalaria pfeifferi]
MFLRSFFGLLMLVPVSNAYSHYQELIPNANNVQHPCIPNYRWPGVGHENRNGGGTRNIFGRDFANAGHQWTRSLCLQDSDGDGSTNGEELGDPSCVWSKGQVPSRTFNITHPGVCEPLTDAKCLLKNNFVSCQLESFDNCNVIKNTDIRTLDLRFPTFSVPASETNYLCMSFDLPQDQDYHVVADQAIINNSNVLHHMLLYGCDDVNSTFYSSPTLCGMSGSVCTSIIAGWTVGQSGSCLGDNVGVRIGVTGYKKARLEIHYNNPSMVSTYRDSSGLRLYYRPARSDVQDLYTLMTGQTMLELPPGQARVEKVGICKGSCTSLLLKQPVYLMSAINHMHYLGRSMKIELYRNGILVANITDDEYYSYDSPKTHLHYPHIQILPGDEIVTKCVYNTMASKRWVYFGEATSDEMCFGFLMIYPKSALNFAKSMCVAKSSLSYCELVQGTPLNGCDWKKFLTPTNPETIRIATDLYKNCNLDGFCRPECKEIVRNISSSPCFQGDTGKFVKSYLAMSKEGLDILGRLQSCPVSSVQNCTVQQCPNRCDVDINGSAYAGVPGVSQVSSYLLVVLLVISWSLSHKH